MSIKAITWDAGGTLIEPWPSVGHVYARAAEEHGFGIFDPDELNRNFARAWAAKGDFDYSRPAWSKLVAGTFNRLEESQLPSLFAQVYERFAEPSAWRVYEDAVPALSACREEGLKMAVVSNWDERLRPLLEGLGLAKFFDAIHVSGELGQHKPSPAIFHAAARSLGVEPEECCHVGDSQREDAEGAAASGMRSALLRRNGALSAPGEIKSLSGLLETISQTRYWAGPDKGS